MFFRSDRSIVAEGKADAFAAILRPPVAADQGAARRPARRAMAAGDEAGVLTVWAYASREAAEEADQLVAADPATAEAQAFQERYLHPL